MGHINHVDLSGNLTRAPEIKATRSGQVIATFGIGNNFKRADGTQEANFFDCVKFLGRSPSEAAQAFWAGLEKGRKVFLSGKLRQDSWESNGERRSRVYVVVDDVDPTGRPQQDQHQPVAAMPPQAPPTQPQQGAELYAEDIPF